MSEKPTPETDAVDGRPTWQENIVEKGWVPADFARRLERERDEFQQIALDAERELQRMEQLVVVKRSNNRSLDARNKRLERELDEARSDLEFRRGLFKVQEEQLNNVREERDQYRGLLIRLHNDLFVHHKGEAVREFKELFREENYN